MASGGSGDLGRSPSTGSGEYLDDTMDSEEVVDGYRPRALVCSPCDMDGTKKKANVFCVECNAPYCDGCLKEHNRFPNMRHHQIQDGSNIQVHTDAIQASSVPTDKCDLHHGKVEDMLCVDHDRVCCSACIALHHRSCTKVEYIPSIAKGTKHSEEYRNTYTLTKSLHANLKEAETNRAKNVADIEARERALLTQVDNHRDRLVLKINKMAAASKEQIRNKQINQTTKVTSEKGQIAELLSTTAQCLRKLENSSNEAQLFVDMKRAKSASKQGNEIVNKIHILSSLTSVQFVKNFGLIKTGDSLGELREAKPVHKTPQGTIKVKVPSDNSTCDISGMVLLTTGVLLITDNSNKKLKRLDTSHKVQDFLDLNGYPIAMCMLSQTEVAISLRDAKKIQLVRIGNTLELSSTVSVKEECAGVYYNETEEELYVCCGGVMFNGKPGLIKSFTREGELKRSIETDRSNGRLFSTPLRIYPSTGGDGLYVIDREKGLILLNDAGQPVWTFNDTNLKRPWGLCEIKDGQMLVCGMSSNNVYQVTADGVGVGEVLTNANGLSMPSVLMYDVNTSTLYVGCYLNEIKLFKIHKT